MTNINIYFDFYCCQSWQKPSDLLSTLVAVTNSVHLVPLENRFVSVGCKNLARPVVQDIPTWFQSNYIHNKDWDRTNFSAFQPQEAFRVFFRTPLQTEWLSSKPIFNTIDIQLSAMRYGEVYNSVSFSCALFSASTITMHQSTLPYIEAVVDLYRAFAQTAVDLFRPKYSYITDTHYKEMAGKEIIGNKLKYIYWWNYYGSNYVAQYGKDIFLRAPSWQVEERMDGIIYQTTQSFKESKDAQIQDKIRQHFRQLKIKDVV